MDIPGDFISDRRCDAGISAGVYRLLDSADYAEVEQWFGATYSLEVVISDMVSA